MVDLRTFFENATQVIVLACGVYYIYLFSCENLQKRRLAWRVMACVQPLWILSTLTHRQFGMLVLSCVYFVIALKGIWKTREKQENTT